VILVLVPMLLCLTVHEYAHALSAQWLGDDTARLMGRMTLNPVAHVDIFGTLLLPIFFIWSNSGFFFGWAKPVPVNPLRFTRRFGGRRVTMRTGMMLTAAAGPLSNVIFGFLAAAALRACIAFGIGSEPVLVILVRLMAVNYSLAIFNMIPIPPLDGSKVLMGLVPQSWTRYLLYLENNTLVAFIVLMVALNTGILDGLLGPAITGLIRLTDLLLGLSAF
jgi:Zn-dependent protease